ncbi:unnamed protein product, partial [Mesorhabditis belari]|uniref:Uncharacterized protein n=1 Tax=Mesorhabditis belari TaxID=2138241 RepID=A0AAF3F145_9BILA
MGFQVASSLFTENLLVELRFFVKKKMGYQGGALVVAEVPGEWAHEPSIFAESSHSYPELFLVLTRVF